MAAARTRLDTISGQLQATRDPSELTAQLAEKRRRLAALQAEYEAIQLAMDTLSAANQTLQNRFSPALGARTAEIFSALTGDATTRYCWTGRWLSPPSPPVTPHPAVFRC